MPRYSNDREFQLGDFWLSKRRGSQAWCRTWFDLGDRQTKRVSLGTTGHNEARQALTDWFVLNHAKKDEKPADATLAEVFARYFEHYGSTIRSSGNIQRALSFWLDFHGAATVEEACQMPRQQAFQKYLRSERRLGPSTTRQVLTIGKAALNWTWKRGEIASVPYIELVKVPKPPPKGRPLDVPEVARLIEASEYHLQAFIILMIATTGRNEAVLSLTFDQVDFANDLIHLNPDKREQTLKFRPTIKLPPSLKPWLQAQSRRSRSGRVIEFRGAPVASIRTAWRTVRAKLEMDDQVQPYGIRHTMARWLRKSSVPAWEVAAQLGHRSPDVSTTEIYAPFDPTYLFKSTAAIDDFLQRVACQLRVSSISELLIERLKDQENQGSEWWFGRDLNSRPRDYESRALTS
jgi:integrase